MKAIKWIFGYLLFHRKVFLGLLLVIGLAFWLMYGIDLVPRLSSNGDETATENAEPRKLPELEVFTRPKRKTETETETLTGPGMDPNPSCLATINLPSTATTNLPSTGPTMNLSTGTPLTPVVRTPIVRTPVSNSGSPMHRSTS